MASESPVHLPAIVLGGLVLAGIYILYPSSSHTAARVKYRYEPPPAYPHTDPFLGLDALYSALRAFGTKNFLDWVRNQYALNGNTFSQKVFTARIINTIEPENIKAILATNFADYRVGGRKEAFAPLFGDSIILSDGARWARSRALLQPTFARSQMADMPMFDKHVGNLLDAILRHQREGPLVVVDLGLLFARLTTDVATDFFFGKSVFSLVTPDAVLEKFDKDFHKATVGGEERWRLGLLNLLVTRGDFARFVVQVHAFIDKYVEEAIQYREALIAQAELEQVPSKSKYRGEQYVVLHELARATGDRKVLRDELLTLYFSGRETTACLLNNLFFVLARRQDVWEQLQKEVDQLAGKKPTFNQLKSMDYVRFCLKESLRLHSPAFGNSRIAIKDTVLPVGGGPDGKSPVFIPAGTLIAYHATAVHRRKDLWGEDADEFKPERWKNEKDTWKYIPFHGSGPRNCVGQAFAMTEAAYTLVRMAQNFVSIETRDPEPWTEKLSITCTSANGVKVALKKR